MLLMSFVILLLIIAAFCDAICDVLKNNFIGSFFDNKMFPPQYWNPDVSYTNKYIGGDKKNGLKTWRYFYTTKPHYAKAIDILRDVWIVCFILFLITVGYMVFTEDFIKELHILGGVSVAFVTTFLLGVFFTSRSSLGIEQFSDAWHTFKTVMIFALCGSVSLFVPDYGLCNIVIERMTFFVMTGTIWNITFSFFYKRFLPQ